MNSCCSLAVYEFTQVLKAHGFREPHKSLIEFWKLPLLRLNFLFIFMPRTCLQSHLSNTNLDAAALCAHGVSIHSQKHCHIYSFFKMLGWFIPKAFKSGLRKWVTQILSQTRVLTGCSLHVTNALTHPLLIILNRFFFCLNLNLFHRSSACLFSSLPVPVTNNRDRKACKL